MNAFCQQQDAEMKGKVLTRLQNITELQNVLGKCLAGEYETFVHSGPVPGIAVDINGGNKW